MLRLQFLRNRLRNRESSAVAEESGCILGKIYFF
jgi:hypothetical protein